MTRKRGVTLLRGSRHIQPRNKRVDGLQSVMSQPVTIENDYLRLDVWPQFGGKVSSIIDKADNHELLFSYASELPSRCQYGMAYSEGWKAGWDECFPAIAPGAYPLHPYEGIAIPDHGELWALPTTAVPTRDGITTVWHGLRFGYRMTRKLYLEDSAVIAEYTLINLAPFDLRFCWSQQMLLSVVSPVKIDFANPLRLRDGNTWPVLDEQNAFEQFDRLPEGCHWKVHSDAPISCPATIRYPDRKRSLTIEYDRDSLPTAYWNILINTGGWEGQRNLSVMPATARADHLHAAVEDESAASIVASGRSTWRTVLRTGHI